jgi:hypothetical protein
LARYHGRQGHMYLQGSGSDAIPMVALTGWSIDLSRDRVDVTCFGDTQITEVQGLPKYTGKFDGFWDDTEDTLWGATDATSGRKMYLYMSRDATSKYFYGTAWVDATMDIAAGDAVKISGTFSAASNWARK